MSTPTLVFLHIPKTAGQTIHTELTRVVGKRAVSPVRVHSQAAPNAQMPLGYRLYSGHIDWVDLETLPEDRFVFTVLRDPLERIASFYLYLLQQAEALDVVELEKPHRTGMRMVRTRSADDYFFGGDAEWQRFILDHYDNFYTSYLATRKMRAGQAWRQLPQEERLHRAEAGAEAIDRIYAVSDLPRLETDLAAQTGQSVQVTDSFVNAGPAPRGTKRWPRLLERIESDANRARLEAFGTLDFELMRKLGIPT
jgi:hypothetical protein